MSAPILVKMHYDTLPTGKEWNWFQWTCRLCGNKGSIRHYHYKWREVAQAGMSHLKRSHFDIYDAMKNGGHNVKTCVWIIQPNKFIDGEFVPAEYCGKPVKWTMEEDGGEPGALKVRHYKTFCPEHDARSTD